MRLGADEGHAHVQAVGPVAEFLLHGSQVQRVGRDDVDGRYLEVLQELELTLGVAGAGRDGQAAQALGAVVDAQAAGEEAVARHVLKGVLGPDADHVHAARHEICPGVHVVSRVVDDRGRARGARGGVQADHVRHGTGQHARGVCAAQVVLGGEWQLDDVVRGGDGGQVDPGLGEAAGVELRAGRAFEGGGQARLLDVVELAAREKLFRTIGFHDGIRKS